jgi:hypothetical protein
MDRFDDQLDVFFGEATPTQARVYAQLPRGDGPLDARLEGTLSGPTCRYAETLPTHYRFRDRGVLKGGVSQDSMLIEAVVPDPCFWTPRLPYLYEVKLELRVGDEVVGRVARPFGIRPLGVRANSFVFAGKRWVFRGGWDSSGSRELQLWRDNEIVMARDEFSARQCDEASHVGVLMAIEAELSEETVRAASRHATVGMLIFDGRKYAGILRKTTNCIFVQNMMDDARADLHGQAEAVLVEASAVEEFIARRSSAIPVIASRPSKVKLEPEEIRPHCDQLQAELASIGDFAGYLV